LLNSNWDLSANGTVDIFYGLISLSYTSMSSDCISKLVICIVHNMSHIVQFEGIACKVESLNILSNICNWLTFDGAVVSDGLIQDMNQYIQSNKVANVLSKELHILSLWSLVPKVYFLHRFGIIADKISVTCNFFVFKVIRIWTWLFKNFVF